MSTEDPILHEDTLQGLPIKLEIFEGPLDLLLHLIREHKVDIADIPIASITEQYLGYLDLMQTLNLDVAGEFLVMAATLMHIKSRMLLPVEDEGEQEQGEDPRQELVRQLEEYQKYKEAGQVLGEFEQNRSRIFGHQSIGPEGSKRTDYPLEVSLFELLSALSKLLETVPEQEQLEIQRERLTIVERITEVLEMLKGAEGEVPFENLFQGSAEVADIVITFLALLELIRLRMVRAWQVEAAGRIMVVDIRPAEEAGPDEGGDGAAPQDDHGPPDAGGSGP